MWLVVKCGGEQLARWLDLALALAQYRPVTPTLVFRTGDHDQQYKMQWWVRLVLRPLLKFVVGYSHHCRLHGG